jgi:selenocysteine lyase/cysteine desulfurase
MREFMIGANANVGYGSETSWLAEQMVESARDAAADLLNCAANEVILGNNMTTVRSIRSAFARAHLTLCDTAIQPLAAQVTMHLSHALSDQIKPGGNIVLSRLDHNANVGPWSRLAAQRGCEVRWLPFGGETYDLDMQQLERLVDMNTRLVAVGMAANSIGTVNDIRHVCKIAREHGTPSLHRTHLRRRAE